MVYNFSIDETGRFNSSNPHRSFVCGILVSHNEETLRKHYQKAYKECALGNDVPSDTKNLLGNKNFHFAQLSNPRKDICREIMLPLVDKIIVSKGKPPLWANNQNFWLIAVVSVILGLFKNHSFHKGDKLNIQIDQRAKKVWGVLKDNEDTKENPKEFQEYHEFLKNQIQKYIEKYQTSPGIEIRIEFVSDTDSFFVNLADLVCGFARTERKCLTPKPIECYCENFMSGENPIQILDKNPVGALNLIFQEVLNDKHGNIGLIQKIFSKTRTNEEKYYTIWNIFQNFLEYNINFRSTDGDIIPKLKEVSDIFLKEFNTNGNRIPNMQLEIINLFLKYYSHIGEINIPIDKDSFIKLLNEIVENSESRITRKWENYVRFSLREAQILFNAYNFSEAVENFEKIWEIHEKILSVEYPFNHEKDEHTTAIIGTLAQSYAFEGELDKAIEFFELSKDYAIKTSSQTASYLLSVYFHKQDTEKVHYYFEKQTQKTPKEYAKKRNFDNVWELLSYTKLRALELYKNNKTDLPEIDITKTSNYRTRYPSPLVLKWAGFAKWIENHSENKEIVSRDFIEAIENLLDEKCGFAIRTLAIPIIQMFAIVDNTNPHHARYDSILLGLKQQSQFFADFVDNRSPLLNRIRNDSDMWTRAISLPFHYA
jgi:hypothetical protein